LTVTPPFHTYANYPTFQKIQALEYTVPDAVPNEARDFITKILQLEPSARLGNGESASDYEPIRNHPFYNGIDWRTLPFAEMPKLPKPSAPPPPGIAKSPSKGEAAAAALTGKPPSQVQDLLKPGETAVFEGTVIKKRKFSTKKRKLVFTTKQRLFDVEMGKKGIMGIIPLGPTTKVKVGKGMKWTVEVPGRTNDLTSAEQQPQEWKAAIDEIIATLQ
jgi:3-phosphoinositide dependent protein kinase-1